MRTWIYGLATILLKYRIMNLKTLLSHLSINIRNSSNIVTIDKNICLFQESYDYLRWEKYGYIYLYSTFPKVNDCLICLISNHSW